MNDITWIFEVDAFPNGDVLFEAIKKSNKKYIIWNDDFWYDRTIDKINNPCLFHGSLANANKMSLERSWTPGAICNEQELSYSFIKKNYNEFLLNKNCIFTTIYELINKPSIIKSICLENDSFFVRPDSCLKHFSGRILKNNNLTPRNFDYGFYHDDINLPIIISPVKNIVSEWRFVVINDFVVTGCKYDSKNREGITIIDANEAWIKAQEIASKKIISEKAYIIDICESDHNLYLLEMNPFSGADFYSCDGNKIMNKIIELIG